MTALPFSPERAALRRRDFVRLATAGFLTAFVAEPGRGQSGPSTGLFRIDPSRPPESVFGLSVASGDPTPSGVILWTRLNPAAIEAGQDVGVEVAADAAFTGIVLRARVAAAQLTAARDFTVKLDLDGYLAAGQRYHYRFIYRGCASRAGRCRTAPAPDADPASLRLAFVTCQDFLAGYYGAFGHIASDDSVDYVLHSGDYIYETFGDPRFQAQTVRQQAISLPSYEPPNAPAPEGGEIVALTLADFRRIYQIYRGDEWLQRAHEQHTWIVGWDDHEMADDNYHDYAGNAAGQSQGAPGHPFANDVDARRQLKFDSQQAWAEYVPARVTYDRSAGDIFGRLRIYRRFRFGRLAELFVTDQRTYRTIQPGGENDFPNPELILTNPQAALASRYFALPSPAQNDPAGTMLGNGTNTAPNQRDWLTAGIVGSPARWKIWSNETYHGRLVVNVPQASLPPDTNPLLAAAVQPVLDASNAFFAANPLLTVNNDAWDGYQAERSLIAQTLAAAGVKNVVALTGDFHSTLASLMKVDYAGPETPANLVGVEYMTPAVSSSSFAQIVSGFLASNAPGGGSDAVTALIGQVLGGVFAQIAGQVLVENGPLSLNPHLKYFESSRHGYAVVEFTPTGCRFQAYAVDRTVNAGPAAPRALYAEFFTPAGTAEIQVVVPPPGPVVGRRSAPLASSARPPRRRRPRRPRPRRPRRR